MIAALSLDRHDQSNPSVVDLAVMAYECGLDVRDDEVGVACAE